MSDLLRQPLARRVLGTTASGALADWTVFAALVVAVGHLTDGSVFAVAIVACARIVPSCVLGPLVAPYAGVFGVRRTLIVVEGTRALTVLVVGLAPSLPALVAGLLTLELAAALGSATREAAISAGVEPTTFRQLNTGTGALSYGMIPLGGLVAALLGRMHPIAPFAAAAVCYLANAVVWATTPVLGAGLRRRRGEVAALDGLRAVRVSGPLRDTVGVAALGAVAIAMLFSIGPAVASGLFTGPEDHGLLLAVLGAGALGGGLLAQGGMRASSGMWLAGAGSLAMLFGGHVGIAGVAVIGAGAAIAYVVTQERLQRTARAPEEFAAAFAVLKVALAVALLGAPVLYRSAGLGGVVVTMLGATLGGLLLLRRSERTAGAPLPLRARVFLAVGRLILPRLCRLDVRGELPDGTAVIVANHPNALDGPVSMLLDRRIRPVAKPQRHPIARLGFALSGTLVTGGGATDAAVEHLRQGGMVWLAPEGGISDGVLRRPRTGAARMAAASGAPIVPMAIRYATPSGPRLMDWRPWRRPLVEITLGTPLEVAVAADPEAVGDRYMRRLALMLRCSYEGEHRMSTAA